MTVDEYVYRCKRKYEWLDEEDLYEIYYFAKEALLNALFPFSNLDEDIEVPKKYEYKLLEVMYEAIDSGNGRHYTSYSENGVSWSRDVSGYSSLKDIVPYGEVY